jgi:hypothetical protein
LKWALNTLPESATMADMLGFLFGFMINDGGITFTGFTSWRLVGEANFKCW